MIQELRCHIIFASILHQSGSHSPSVKFITPSGFVHWVFWRWLLRPRMDEATLDEKRRMRTKRAETVGGLLVSMEVNNENLMTRGLQKSISFFSSFSLPPFLSSHCSSILPAEPTPFSTSKIPPPSFPVGELIFTPFAQQKIFISKLPMEQVRESH